MLFTLLPHSFSREWSAVLWGNSSSWPRAGAQLGQRGEGHTTPFPARASHLTKAIPAKVGRLGQALAPALGSSGLRSLAARRWCCADPREPVDVILGMPVTGQGGWVCGQGEPEAMSACLRRTWWHSRGLLRKSASRLLPPGDGKHSPHRSQETHQGAGALPPHPGEEEELIQAHLKYITTAQMMWRPLWVLGAARNNKTTDKGWNPDTESTKGLFLLQWGKAAAFPPAKTFCFQSIWIAPNDFLPALPSCLFLIPAVILVPRLGRSQHAVPLHGQNPHFHDSVVGNNWNISE